MLHATQNHIHALPVRGDDGSTGNSPTVVQDNIPSRACWSLCAHTKPTRSYRRRFVGVKSGWSVCRQSVPQASRASQPGANAARCLRQGVAWASGPPRTSWWVRLTSEARRRFLTCQVPGPPPIASWTWLDMSGARASGHWTEGVSEFLTIQHDPYQLSSSGMCVPTPLTPLCGTRNRPRSPFGPDPYVLPSRAFLHVVPQCSETSGVRRK